MATATSPWLKPAEAADYLRTTPESLEWRRRNRRGPTFSKVGKFVRYHRDDLDRWLKSHRVA